MSSAALKTSLQATRRQLLNGHTIDPAKRALLGRCREIWIRLGPPGAGAAVGRGGQFSPGRVAYASLAKGVGALAKLLPATSNLVRRIDQAGIDMWKPRRIELVRRIDQAGIDMWNRAKREKALINKPLCDCSGWPILQMTRTNAPCFSSLLGDNTGISLPNSSLKAVPAALGKFSSPQKPIIYSGGGLQKKLWGGGAGENILNFLGKCFCFFPLFFPKKK